MPFSFVFLSKNEQDRQFQQYMLRDPVFDPTKFPFSRIPTSLSIPFSSTKSPTDIPRDRPRDPRETSRESTLIAEASNPEVSPQVVSAAATLANMDFGTRFPFGQQSIKQAEKEPVSVVEQGDGANRRTMIHNVLREENGKINCKVNLFDFINVEIHLDLLPNLIKNGL